MLRVPSRGFLTFLGILRSTRSPPISNGVSSRPRPSSTTTSYFTEPALTCGGRSSIFYTPIMPVSNHGRSDSDGSSTVSSYPSILEHVFTYPASYEIPLRTMYSLNCNPRGQARSNASSSNASSPITAQDPWRDHNPTQTFQQNLMDEISQIPTQPVQLPPAFLTGFARKCFKLDLRRVDFPQALTGLDYLKDLETRRRREVAAAMDRLDIDASVLGAEADLLSVQYPGVAQWVKMIEEKERKVDAIYTQLYIGLRRWIIINELSLTPFSKHNCVAMLNTLYPPVTSSQPTSKLTPSIMKHQRDGFFKYIQSVERNGTRVLSTLMQQGQTELDENGWEPVVRTMHTYLQVASSMISECAEISVVEDVSPRKNSDSTTSRHSRKAGKADSGVSFNASEKLSDPPVAGPEPSSPVETTRPKTPTGGRSGTALEKIARGLKTIGRSRTDVTEMVPSVPAPVQSSPPKAKGLRKMRSLGALDGRNGSKTSIASSRKDSVPTFDADEMRAQRLKYEAGALAQQKFDTYSSHEA